jgi:uncharacterized protein (TIGR01244 family)
LNRIVCDTNAITQKGRMMFTRTRSLLAVTAIVLALLCVGCEKPAPPAPANNGEPTNGGAAPADVPADGGADTTPAAKLESAKLGDTPNVHAHGDVYLCGQPTAADLLLAKSQGATTIIDLRMPGEDRGYDEAKAAADAGLDYVNIPFSGTETLTDEVFDKVRAELKAAEGKVIVHCGSANRVGGVWLAHRVLDGGLEFDAALAEAKQVGLRNEGFIDQAKQYIERQKQAQPAPAP